MVKMNTENLISVLPSNIAASTDLTHSQKKVLGQLIVYSGLEEARNNDGWFYRSNEDLCSDVEVSKPTLIEALRKLKAEDLIDRRVGSRSVGASEYKVKSVNLDTYPSNGKMGKVENFTNNGKMGKVENFTNNGKMGKVENFTNNGDVNTMILNELIKLNEAIGKIGKVLESLDFTQMDVLDAILSMGKMGKVEKPTPDTDTDTETSNILSINKGKVSMDDCCSDVDCNKKFSEQYNRILRAIREVQTTDSSDRIELLQRVMDDATEKARMYATDGQLQLIEYRISDFQKAAGAEEANLPHWIQTLPDATSLYPLDAAIIGFFQCVQQGLADTPDERQRDRYRDICLRRAKKVFTFPLAADRGWDAAKAESVIEGNFYARTEPSSEKNTDQTDNGQEEDAYWQEYDEQAVQEQDQNEGVDRILDDIANGTISSEADLARRIEIASRTNELVEANASWLMDKLMTRTTA